MARKNSNGIIFGKSNLGHSAVISKTAYEGAGHRSRYGTGRPQPPPQEPHPRGSGEGCAQCPQSVAEQKPHSGGSMNSLRNDIPTRQASDESRDLLRARHRNYHAAKVTQGLLVLVSILMPVIGVWIGPQVPEVRPYLALASLLLLVMETALIDRIQKDRLKRGAKAARAVRHRGLRPALEPLRDGHACGA